MAATVHHVVEFGLTGGIGSGKSAVAERLVARGAVVLDADAIVRELQEPGRPVFVAMVEAFGDGVVGPDGRLDRAAVAERAFADPEALEMLNRLVHPAVAEELQRRRDRLRDTDAVVVLDIPLLVQPGRPPRQEFRNLDGIIVVDVPEALQIRRLVEGRGFDQADARARMANQATREERLAVADFVIDNRSDLAHLDTEVDRCWAWMAERARSQAVDTMPE